MKILQQTNAVPWQITRNLYHSGWVKCKQKTPMEECALIESTQNNLNLTSVFTMGPIFYMVPQKEWTEQKGETSTKIY